MFTSIKSRLLLLITLIMSVTGSTVMFFSHRDVGNAMRSVEELSARNVLELVELNIRGGYNRLISDKIEILTQLKNELRQMTRVAASVLSDYHSLTESGRLPESLSRDLALGWIRGFDFDSGGVFVFDDTGKVLAASNRSLATGSIAEIRDLKGRALLQSMNSRDLGESGDDAVFVWPRERGGTGGKNMGFFIPIKAWGWTVAGVIDFENIEAESQRKLDAIVEGLRKTLDKVRIATSGYVFLFDGAQRMLVPPPGQADTLTEAQRVRLADLASAAAADSPAVRYLDPFASSDVLVEAYVTYFKAFDWYIAVAVPVSEIQAPGDALLKRQSLIVVTVFLAALIAAWMLVSKLSAPLNELAEYAKSLSLHDFTKDWTRDNSVVRALAKRQHEFGRLAKAFLFMELELRRNVRNAIETTAAKERLEREAAVEAARAKDEFLANMSHEIRTPIHGILGLTDVLLDTGLEDKQGRLVRTVKSTGEALLGIINDILDFSKIEAYKLELEFTEFRLDELVDRVAEQFAEVAQRKGLELVVTVAPECARVFRGDPGRLRQILVNLCGNAMKFTSDGEVTIHVAQTGQVGPHCQIRFDVRDSGIGMDDAAQARIFKPFAQADSSTTRRYGGTGLGLAICKRLVELMHGQIGVDSTPGKGSTFWFTAGLSIVEGERSGHPLDSERSVARALVVHGNATARDSLAERVQHIGVDVSTVAEGIEAVERLYRAQEQGRPYAVVLVDTQTVGMPGIELARRVRETARLADTRVCLMVGVVDEDGSERKAREIGVTCLTKPVQQSALERVLRVDGGDVVSGADNEVADRAPVTRLRGRILVAEDNPLNRELTLEMLRAYECEIVMATNGREAVEAFSGQAFDLVLMDCQMPELDGFQAATRLRELEAESGRPRVPIVALTANAMRGDREACLAAGMDDYLAKPFSAAALRERIATWIDAEGDAPVDTGEAARVAGPDRHEGPAPCEAAVSTDDEEVDEVLDASALDNIRAADLEGSCDLLIRCIETFEDSVPAMLRDMRHGIDTGDVESVRRIAHTLKSNCANLGAEVLRESFRAMEELTRSGTLDGAAALALRIDAQTARVLELLQHEKHRMAA